MKNFTIRMVLALTLIGLALLSCEEDEVLDVYIEIENQTGNTIESVTVYSNGIQHNYGELLDDEVSETFKFFDTYVADSVKVVILQEVSSFYPDRLLIQWKEAEKGADYVYTLSKVEGSPLTYDIRKSN